MGKSIPISKYLTKSLMGDITIRMTLNKVTLFATYDIYRNPKTIEMIESFRDNIDRIKNKNMSNAEFALLFLSHTHADVYSKSCFIEY